jgi:hypothetical protein
VAYSSAGPAAQRPMAQAALQLDAWACQRAHKRMVTAAAAGAVARAALAHRWARCGLMCGMSTTGVESTHWATQGSERLTVTVVWHEDDEGGPAQRRSEEVVVLRGTACSSDVPFISRKKRG